MTRLVLRDATRRYGAGLTFLVLTGGYLWRSLPPWVIRDWLWALPSRQVALVVFGAASAYLLITYPVARQLVASERLSYWRQFAIPVRCWRNMHARHLAIANAPAAATLLYLTAPAKAATAFAVTAVAYPILLALQWQLVSIVPQARSGLALPEPRTPWGAIARLYGLTVWRRERTCVALSLGWQLGLMGLCVLGSFHVAEQQPRAAWPLIRTLTVASALAGAWPALVAARAIDRDRWFLDSLGIPGRTEATGRLVLGLALCGPTLIASWLAGSTQGIAAAGYAGLLGLSAAVFAAAAYFSIAVTSEARRDLHSPRTAAVAGRAAYGAALLHLDPVLGPLALLAAAVVEVSLGLRSTSVATDARTRLETTTNEDDHG